MTPGRCPCRIAIALVASVALTWATGGFAADHALLIGVSDYPALPKRLWLRGPINDVALVRETLLIRGFNVADIRVLQSRTEPRNEPTRSNILSAMADTLRRAQAGDRVVLYLAGHGSQQPQPKHPGRRPIEPDGLDEVFLPADVHQWDGSGAQAAIPNALLDDEIGEWIDALVDRGAKVWAVFDTCHAAGMGRGDARAGMRGIAPAELGVAKPPDSSPRRPPKNVQPVLTHGRTDGRLLLHAARAHELTGEEWMPKGSLLQRSRLHGVFTFHLMALWRERRAEGARQIESDLHEAYRKEGRAQPRPTAMGEEGWGMP